MPVLILKIAAAAGILYLLYNFILIATAWL